MAPSASHSFLICRAASAAFAAVPFFANAGGPDAGEVALPKVRALLAMANEQGQTLHPERVLAGAQPTAARLVFTMQAEMSPSTSVLFERSRAVPLNEPAAARLITAPATRVGVEFRPVSAANSLKPIGTLRVQLSDNSSLSLKPRRGGVLVSWRSQF